MATPKTPAGSAAKRKKKIRVGRPAAAGKAGTEQPPAAQRIEVLAIADIVPSPLNRHLDDDDPALAGLADSIERFGLANPISVRPLPEAGKYEIVCGERRWRACRRLEYLYIQAVVWDVDDQAAQAMRWVENIERKDLSHIEEGDAVAGLLALHGGDVSEVAARLGRSESFVRRRARLPHLSEAWRAELAKADTFYQHIRDSVERMEELALLPAPEQEALLDSGALRWAKKTAEMRQVIRLRLRRLDSRPWPDDSEAKLPAGERCDGCAKRTDREGDLFAALADADGGAPDKSALCLDTACWHRKTALYLHDVLYRADKLAKAWKCPRAAVLVSSEFVQDKARRESVESVCGRAVSDQDWAEAGKAEDGGNWEEEISLAVPVDGEKLGQILEVKFWREEPEGENGEQSGEDRKAALAARKAEHERYLAESKHRQLECNAFDRIVGPMLEGCPRPDPLGLLRLLASYGAEHFEKIDMASLAVADIEDMAWNAMRQAIADESWYTPNDNEPARKAVCEALGIDWEAVRVAMDEVLAREGDGDA